MTELNNMCAPCRCAAALGIFDGVHAGHREIISAAVRLKEKCLVPAVFTLDTQSVKRKHGKPFEYIYTNRQKLKLLGELGIEYAYSPSFDSIRDMDGEEFAAEILAKRLKAGAAICGENFRFGKNASCGAEELVSFGKKYGFEVKVISLKKYNGKVFSSELFRSMLREGRVLELLGMGLAPYFIDAEVIEGNRIGRTLNFPTINQRFESGQLVPRKGVYHSHVNINGICCEAITNVGVKPTVEKDIAPLAETHILDYSGDLYGESVRVALRCFIRDEQKFASVEELKRQVDADIEYVRRQKEEICCKESGRKD